MIKQIELEVQDKGEYTGIREMRKHLCYYVKGLENAAHTRSEINKIEHLDELLNFIRNL